jgi:hypothetical protein
MSELKGDHSNAIERSTQALDLAQRYGLEAYGAMAKSASVGLRSRWDISIKGCGCFARATPHG